MSKDAANVRLEMSNVGKDAANVRLERSNVVKDAANVYLERCNVGKDAANVCLERSNVGKDAASVSKDATNMSKTKLMGLSKDAIGGLGTVSPDIYWRKALTSVHTRPSGQESSKTTEIYSHITKKG